MTTSTYETLWEVAGFGGQLVFTARFVVQWVVSEKKRASVMPVAFWWISLAGGMITLCYAVHKWVPPFIVGQSMGLLVYTRNLMLVAKAKRRAARAEARGGGTGVLRGPHPPRVDKTPHQGVTGRTRPVP